jgi:DNA-binding PadR family transcriptional regulator
MSAKHAVLGLVIERPGYGYQLAQRLDERFGSSGFAPSGVYSALDQLSRDELVRSAGEMSTGRAGRAQRAAPRTVYEATDEGLEHFESWMLDPTPAPPLRDELHMKIALCRPANVPQLIEAVAGQELVCLGRLQDLKRLSEETASSRDWSRLMGTLAGEAEVAFWKARIEWLQNARDLLEQLRDEHQMSPFGVGSTSSAAEMGLLREV